MLKFSDMARIYSNLSRFVADELKVLAPEFNRFIRRGQDRGYNPQMMFNVTIRFPQASVGIQTNLEELNFALFVVVHLLEEYEEMEEKGHGFSE